MSIEKQRTFSIFAVRFPHCAFMGNRHIARAYLLPGRGQQVIGYLNGYQIEKQYMLRFCFNKKNIGVQGLKIGSKSVVEGTV